MSRYDDGTESRLESEQYELEDDEVCEWDTCDEPADCIVEIEGERRVWCDVHGGLIMFGNDASEGDS